MKAVNEERVSAWRMYSPILVHILRMQEEAAYDGSTEIDSLYDFCDTIQ